jgi:hypothetical protein
MTCAPDACGRCAAVGGLPTLWVAGTTSASLGHVPARGVPEHRPGLAGGKVYQLTDASTDPHKGVGCVFECAQAVQRLTLHDRLCI